MRETLVALALLVGGCTTGARIETADETTSASASTTTVSTTTTPRSSTTSTLAATTTTQPALLDFSQIKGSWSGPARDGFERFWLTAEIKSEAVAGESVGTVKIYEPDERQELWCEGRWLAVSAEPPLYEVRHSVSGCPSGDAILDFDLQSGSLHWDLDATDPIPEYDSKATLSRPSP